MENQLSTLLKKLRVGYVPLSKNLESPGDRRRFIYYAKIRNIDFEIADPSRHYDLVVVTGNADISIWRDYKSPGAKIIFDFIDSYLAIPRTNLKARLRGLGKFLFRQNKRFQPNYWSALEAMCARSDAVICSTEEQARDIHPFCNNTHIILDIHSHVARTHKKDYSSGKVFNLVWEGLPGNAHSLHLISEVLKTLQKKYAIALHVVTDLEFKLYLGKFWALQTSNIISSICDKVYLYQWNEQMFSNIIGACDLAVIPIDLDDSLASGKPENKLLLFWRMGIPTVVSSTPAYKRAMAQAGLPMACATKDEWTTTLEHYINNEEDRRAAGLQGKTIADSFYNENVLLSKWDTAISQLF